jgi:hypothetical protein
VGLNPHVSLTQGYEGCNVQNPQRSQMMQLQTIELQQQVEESMQRHTKFLLRHILLLGQETQDLQEHDSCREGGGGTAGYCVGGSRLRRSYQAGFIAP